MNAILHDQRNCQLGADVRVRLDVMFFFGYVVNSQAPPLQGSLAHDAAPHFEAGALDLGGVAYLEAHPELLGAIVDQQDGEDSVVDDGPNQIRDPVHQGIEVERSIERIGQGMQELDLMDWVDADIRSLWGLVGAHGR